jgi:hypothetical protein
MKMMIMLDYHIALNLDDNVDDYYLDIEEVDDDLVVNRFAVVVIEQSPGRFDRNHFDDVSYLEDYDIVVLQMSDE